MAEEFDQAEYDRLRGQQSSVQGEYDACQSQINTIEAEIEALRDAYDKLDAAKEAVKDLRNNLKHVPGDYYGKWAGALADPLKESSKSGGDLYEKYSNYIDAVDNIEDSINWDINSKKEVCNEKYGILAGLKNRLDDIGTLIRNLFN